MDPVSSQTPSLRLSLRALNRAAAATVGLLLVLGIAVEALAIRLEDDWLFGLLPILSPRYSQNLPTWTLAALFASASLLAILLTAIDRVQRRPVIRWLGLTIVMLAASLEVFTGASAGLMAMVRAVAGPAALAELVLLHPVRATLVFSLALALGGAVLVVGYRSLRAWWSLPPVARRGLALGIALLAAAPWIEARSLPFRSLGWLSGDETQSASLAIWFELAQSSVTLLGASLLCLALISLLAERGRAIQLTFGGVPDARGMAAAELRRVQELPAAAS